MLAAIPVAGWIALGVIAVGVGGYLIYRAVKSSDNKPDSDPGSTQTCPLAAADEKPGEQPEGGAPDNRPPNKAPEGANRDEALEKIKKDLNIPADEQPDVRPNIKGGKAQPGSENLDYLDRDGNVVTIRHDYDGHEFPDDPTQNRGPHFNGPDGSHYDYTGKNDPFGPLRR